MAAIKYWIWLSAQTEVSPASRAALIEYYGSAEAAYFAPRGEFCLVPGVTPADAARLELRDLSETEKILAACRRQNIRPVTMQDAAYPERLRNIYAPPAVLYVKGKLPPLDEEAA